MTFVLDTSVLVDHLRRRVSAGEAFMRLIRAGEEIASPVMVRVELARGLRAHQAAGFESLDLLIAWVPVTLDIGATAVELAERFGRSHSAIDPVDYVVAATASHLEAALWTTNVRHFPMFPELEAPY